MNAFTRLFRGSASARDESGLAETAAGASGRLRHGLAPLMLMAAEGGAEAGLTAQGTEALSERITAELCLMAAERFAVEHADTLVGQERLLVDGLTRLRAAAGPRSAKPAGASEALRPSDWWRSARLTVALTCGVIVAGSALRATAFMDGAGWLMLAMGGLGVAAIAPERASLGRGQRDLGAWWRGVRCERRARPLEARLAGVRARQVAQGDLLARREEWLAWASALVLAELRVQHNRGARARTMGSGRVEEVMS